ncbi:MAG: sterol desaturase family protein [Planctomycetota bacterium]
MTLVYTILFAGAMFVVMALIFRPLERVFPAKPDQPMRRPGFWLDLSFFVGQYVLWNGLCLWVVAMIGGGVRWLVPSAIVDTVASWPLWVQFPIVILLGDGLIYWGHRLQHRVGFLWRFHAIHHSAEHLDWLAAHREHPLDTIFTITLVNLPVFALGFPVEALALFAGFRGLWAIFIHANVRLPIGPLRVLIGAPELHHWHHDKARDAGNYANVSPIFDLLFGTYVHPGHEPEAFGVEEPSPKSYLGQLLWPFRRKKHADERLTLGRAGGDD